MDHLPVPNNPARPTPRVRYVCRQEYDRGNFLTYPERLGMEEGDILDLNSDDALAFFQQWLFFGLLDAVFGDAVNFSDFIDVEEGSPGCCYIHTRGLWESAQTLIEKERVEGVLTHRGLEHLRDCFEKALWGYITANCRRWGPLDPYFLASLAATGRFLLALAKSLHPDVFDAGLHWFVPKVYPPFEHEGLRSFEAEGGYISLFGLHMAQTGWCPRQVALFADHPFETQYYCSQIPLFGAKRLDHRDCTRTSCMALQTTKTTYRTKHNLPYCNCQFLEVDPAELERILRNGDIPLVRFEGDKLTLVPAEATTTRKAAFYIAISHVWSDGLGNPTNNAMPLCQLRQINKLLQDHTEASTRFSGNIAFWIDTLCCPANSSDGRKLAISRMGETYARAASVLVLSADLQTINAAHLSTMDLMYFVYLSAWASRLWTWQEGSLARQLYLQFKDRAVQLLPDANIINSWGILDGEWVDYISYIAIWQHIRGKTLQRSDGDPHFLLLDAMRAIRYKTTSIATDEAICLGSLLGADMKSIVRAAPADRMEALWTSIPRIPWSIIFESGTRMEAQGFRWAPRSLLGMVDIKCLEDPSDAQITPDGLLVEGYGIVLEKLAPPLRHDIHDPLQLVDCDGELYFLFKDMDTSASGEGIPGKYSVPIQDFIQIALVAHKSPLEPFQCFVMVFIYRMEDGTTYARRGDSGQLIRKTPSTLSVFSSAENELQLRRVDSGPGGSEHCLLVEDHWLHSSTLGRWDNEPRRWCID